MVYDFLYKFIYREFDTLTWDDINQLTHKLVYDGVYSNYDEAREFLEQIIDDVKNDRQNSIVGDFRLPYYWDDFHRNIYREVMEEKNCYKQPIQEKPKTVYEEKTGSKRKIFILKEE